MSPRAILLVVMVLICCLVSTVSAGCSSCGLVPKGGWGPPDFSDNPYWGMSVTDIMNARSSAAKGNTTSGSGNDQPPALIIPSYNGDKFGSLFDYRNKFGDSQAIINKKGSVLKPDVDGSSNLIKKQLFL